MFTKLDRYIIKKYLGTFFFMMGLIMAMAVVFDISERIDDFIAKNAPLKGIIFDYYFNFIFYYGNLFSALIIFIAVIWFTAKMAQNAEIIPILSSGVSFNRFLWPYFVGATFLTVISLGLNHYIIPKANLQRLEFEEQFYRNEYATLNGYLQIAPGEVAYYSSYKSSDDFIVNFYYEKWENDRMVFFLKSTKAHGDSTNTQWQFDNYFIREIGKENDVIRRGKVLDTNMNFKLTDFLKRNNIASAMTTSELTAFIAQEKQRGSNQVPFYELEKYQRTAYPFATYVLTLIGVAVSSRKSRQGIGVHIATGLFLVFIFIFFMRVSTVATTNLGVPAYFTVWIPNVLFGLIAIWLYRRAPK